MTTQPVNPSNTDEPTVGPDWLRGENAIRFVKFGVVGGLGVVVNWVFFELGYFAFGSLGERWAVLAAYTLGLVVSIFTNFVLNDIWTWADRVKGGIRHWFVRMGKYYVSASVAGVVQVAVSWLSLQLVWAGLGLEVPGFTLPMSGWRIPAFDLGPRLGLLTGVACGMIINFLASHLWAFEDAEVS